MTILDRSSIKPGCVGAAEASTGRASTTMPSRPPLMKVGTQGEHSDEWLRYLTSFGLKHICSDLPSRHFDENWSVESLLSLREHIESFGIKLEIVPLPLSSVPITVANYPNILLGKSPERDREIDEICAMIRNCGMAGIPTVKYNLTFLGIVRTHGTSSRGGAICSAFDHEGASLDPETHRLAQGTEEMMWERIEYFLKIVVPVAEDAKVRIACHPNDPGMPKGGFHGVPSVLSSVEGLKRFINIMPSPYHGLNFCQGTVCEMLSDPAEEIYDVIRYFGQRKKLFNVHYRNIKGHFLNFHEAFPDDGDVDMLKCMSVYQEVEYDGMIMPDHVPLIEGDKNRQHAYAFALGYIQAAIQMLKNQGQE